MNQEIFMTVLDALVEKIQMLEFRLDSAQKENRELREQVNDMFIKIHVGKESKE
jgi:hypothetical protein